MLPLATVEQLSARLGITPTGGDAERALAALEDASALIRSEAAVDWIDDSDALSDVPSVIEAITLAVAYRAYQNPTGASQTSLGDASVSYAREGSGGAVYLTRDERKAVRKAAGISSVGSIALLSPWMAEAANYYYAEVEGGGDPIPLGPLPWEL